MFQSIQKKGMASNELTIDIAPLIDIVFILLIFFMVTTTFIKDTGIQVEKPQASSVVLQDTTSLRVSITASGNIYCQGGETSLNGLTEITKTFLQEHPTGSCVVIPDIALNAGRLVEVMDIVKLAGIGDIAISAIE